MNKSIDKQTKKQNNIQVVGQKNKQMDRWLGEQTSESILNDFFDKNNIYCEMP